MTLHAPRASSFRWFSSLALKRALSHSRTLNNPDELEEERRLCYVGMTRA